MVLAIANTWLAGTRRNYQNVKTSQHRGCPKTQSHTSCNAQTKEERSQFAMHKSMSCCLPYTSRRTCTTAQTNLELMPEQNELHASITEVFQGSDARHQHPAALSTSKLSYIMVRTRHVRRQAVQTSELHQTCIMHYISLSEASVTKLYQCILYTKCQFRI